jgi:membrane protein implicated in regulation of membrane protease activity
MSFIVFLMYAAILGVVFLVVSGSTAQWAASEGIIGQMAVAPSFLLATLLFEVSLFFLYFRWKKKKEEKKKNQQKLLQEKLQARISELENAGFSVAAKVQADLGRNVLLYDDKAREIGLIQRVDRAPLADGENAHFGTPFRFRGQDIVEASVQVDGASVQKASGDIIGRGIVGGVIAGGAGAILGGMTADRISHQTVHTIDLNLIVDHPKTPWFRIRFFEVSESEAVPKSHPVVQSAVQIASIWCAYAKSVMHHAKKQPMRVAEKRQVERKRAVRTSTPKEKSGTQPSTKENSSAPLTSKVDDLSQLLELRNSGEISQDAFKKLAAPFLSTRESEGSK